MVKLAAHNSDDVGSIPAGSTNDRTPVSTLEELDELNSDEVMEGYRDGYNGWPEPGLNRSKSYWHGWRNGAVDGKHRESDWAQRKLAYLVIKYDYFKNCLGIGPHRLKY